MRCCLPRGADAKNGISASEAIELIEERSRHVATQISYLDHQMRKNAADVRTHVKAHDMEQARVHMRRIRMLKDKRTRYLGVKEKLWAMKHTLEEQSMYTALHDTFQSGAEVMDSLLQKVNVERIEELMDRFQEQADETMDVGNALAEPTHVSIGDGDVEESIEQELRLLMGGVEEQPVEPTKEVIVKEEEEEKEEHVVTGRRRRELAI